MTSIEEHLALPLKALRARFAERFPDYGTSWRDTNIVWCYDRLEGETDELWVAILNGHPYSRVFSEAIDVALCALMTADMAIIEEMRERAKTTVSHVEQKTGQPVKPDSGNASASSGGVSSDHRREIGGQGDE
jgi:hypothetical protein